MERRNSRKIRVGNIFIGGGERISVQSMLNVIAEDAEGNVRQAVELEKALFNGNYDIITTHILPITLYGIL